MLADTLKMIPDCRKRLELAADDLANYLVSVFSLLIRSQPKNPHANAVNVSLTHTPFFFRLHSLGVQEGLEHDTEINGTDEYTSARSILTQVQTQLQSPLPTV